MNYSEKIKQDLFKLYIDGQFVESESGETFDFVNPATGDVFGQGSWGGLADVQKAIKAARKAFDEGPWGQMSGRERGAYLKEAGRILERRKDEFAILETLDAGKQYMGMLYYELLESIDAFDFYSHKARTLGGDSTRLHGNTLNYVDWYPYGVVGEILPWNGPLMMGCQKIAAILAAGNTVIVKPPTWASASLLLLAEVFDEAGFPPGVVNVVSGPGSTVGIELVKSEDVDMVSMTGGTDTGKQIMTAASDTVKAIALELGGKSPNIFFDDVDVKDAASWAVHGFTLHSGQVCVSGTRVLVQRSIYEELLSEMAEVVKRYHPGNGFDFEKGVNFSTLIHADHAKSVWNYIDIAKKEGGRLIAGGEPYQDAELQKGNYVPPTIFADVTPDMTIFNEEIFGPVGSVTPFDTEEEAIALANMTKYGLAGGVFSKDIKRAHRVAQKMKGGQIYVNSYFSSAILDSPGTGWKQSGIGVAGIHKYMISKTVFVDLNDGNQPPV